MKQNENILLSTATVKLLTMKELHSVRFMDVVSDFYVEQWLEENTDYAWGIFKNETDELMGYCTIGYADDTSDIIEKHPEHTDDSLLLSDVYIKPQFRNKGYGIKLITEVIRKRWELDGNKNTVYLVAMYDKLMYFYGWCCGAEGEHIVEGKNQQDIIKSMSNIKVCHCSKCRHWLSRWVDLSWKIGKAD